MASIKTNKNVTRTRKEIPKKSRLDNLRSNFDQEKIKKDFDVDEDIKFPSRIPSITFNKKTEEKPIEKPIEISEEDLKCKQEKKYQLYDFLVKRIKDKNTNIITDTQMVSLTISSWAKELPYEEALKHYIEIFGIIREHQIRGNNNERILLNNMPYRGEYSGNNIIFLLQNIPPPLMAILEEYIELFSED